MTQEQKDLLLKDLCARLPYGVAVKIKVNEVAAIKEEFIYNVDGEYSYITNGKSYLTLDIIKAIFNNHLDEIKPYLFPLSSMSEEQERELEELDPEFYTIINDNGTIECVMNNKTFDWFHKHHFDWRGLIPKGLALDATGLNIY